MFLYGLSNSDFLKRTFGRNNMYFNNCKPNCRCHTFSSKSRCVCTSPRQRFPACSSTLVSDCELFAIWMVAYWRSDCCWKVSVYRGIAIRGCLNARIVQRRSLHVEGIANIMGGVIDFTSLFFFLNKNIVFLAQAEFIILFSADFRQNILNYS